MYKLWSAAARDTCMSCADGIPGPFCLLLPVAPEQVLAAAACDAEARFAAAAEAHRTELAAARRRAEELADTTAVARAEADSLRVELEAAIAEARQQSAERDRMQKVGISVYPLTRAAD